MDNPSSFKTELKDRTLYYDGSSVFNTDDLIDLIERYDVRYVNRHDSIVDDYNRLVPSTQKIQVKNTCGPLDLGWNIPQEYARLDVERYVFERVLEQAATDPELEQRLLRCSIELEMFEQRGLLDVLKAIIYVINTLTQNNQVWGVGRGSCVSSYVLYVIGVHDVDSYAYELEITDFLHD